MKLLKLALISFVVLPNLSHAGPWPTSKQTTCNVRYNNQGIVAGNVPCKAWFSTTGNLQRVRFLYPQTGAWYDWSTAQSSVQSDKRWDECVRFTRQDGNQWQVCTVPSPKQLGF